jgi:taurine dioxygenase
VALARRFGSVTPAHPVMPGGLADIPEVLVLDSRRMRASREHAPTEARSRGAGWHTDVTFMPTPPAGSILSAQVIPDTGGDRLWADTQAAYERLDEPVRRLACGLAAVHDGRQAFAGFLAAGRPVRWEGVAYRDLAPVEHPVVRTHPETLRRFLFVNPQFTSHIAGLPAWDGAALLDLLYVHMTVPEVTVRHRSRPGDVAFWDNRATMHYATLDYGDADRVMHRVTLRGDRPA